MLTQIISVLPTIFSLILIEGLLSVDNAMGMAAMARHLPEKQQKAALRWGIIGAYAMRGLSLLLASWIVENQWVKILGAVYLLWLAAHGLMQEAEDDVADAKHKPHVARSFIATVIAIEVMDLTLSIDNVVAAVALDSRIWVVCIGVFIGILALRFVAGYCIALMERFPVLEKTAFLLIGFVGVLLSTELLLEHYGIPWKITPLYKFVGIVCIVGFTIFYSEFPWGQKTGDKR